MPSCQYCDKEFKHARGFHVHEMNCRRKKEKGNSASEKPNKCEHDFRLLNLSDVQERIAYDSNFKEVCKTCQELR